jgi:adenosylcobinamide-phosphate synthase
VLTLTFAMIVDAIFGDPIYTWHPVRLMGLSIEYFEKRLNKNEMSNQTKLVLGGLLVALVLCLCVIVYSTIQGISLYLLGKFAIVIEGLLVYQLLATRCLYDEGNRILKVIQTGDLEKAQGEIGYLVSRDTDALTMQDIKKAAVETLTENITDGVIAPIFYYGLFGLSGIVLYKAINTMDSMIAYKNERYLYFGRVAAYVDDVANFIPARIASVLIILSSLIFKDNTKESLRCFKEHRTNHASPNAGCTEAAIAGALQIKLSGPTMYFGQLKEKPFIGYGPNAIEEIHIKKVMNYIISTTLIMWAAMMIVQVVY